MPTPHRDTRFDPVRALREVLAEPSRRGRIASWVLAVTAVLVAAALLYVFFPNRP
jgi:hypothetical protein